MRGDRCEGIYTRAVALGEVRLAGVHWKPRSPPSLQGRRSMRLEWPVPPTGNPVGLRALAMRPRLFYRMDSVRPAGASGYDWPTELISRLRLTPGELGIMAWSALRLRGVNRDILLPVGLGGEGGYSPNIELSLISDVQLREIYLTIFPVGADGSLGAPIARDRPVGRGFYPANRGLPVALPTLPRPGLYRVDIGSRFMTGGAAASSQYIYAAQPPR